MESRSSPWRAARGVVPALAGKLEKLGCPRVRLVVDSEVVYWGLQVPEGRLEGWLENLFEGFERGWPEARTVEMFAVWGERVERVLRVFPRGAGAALPSEETCG
jgi:hypothetical protein